MIIVSLCRLLAAMPCCSYEVEANMYFATKLWKAKESLRTLARVSSVEWQSITLRTELFGIVSLWARDASPSYGTCTYVRACNVQGCFVYGIFVDYSM